MHILSDTKIGSLWLPFGKFDYSVVGKQEDYSRSETQIAQ
jgi:hypothetical protein